MPTVRTLLGSQAGTEFGPGARGTVASKADARAGSRPRVVTIAPTATVRDAAALMNDHRIGSLVVVGSTGALEGIITERDVLTRVVAAGLDPARTPVRDVMTGDVITCDEDSSLDDLRRIMQTRRVRHLPVTDRSGKPVGMVSIGDLNDAQVRTMSEAISYLETYMTAL